MSTATLTVSGEILSAYESSWRDPDTKREKMSKVVQFLRVDAKGRSQVLNVKLPDTSDLGAYPKGKKVTMAVDVLAMDSTVYFRAMGDADATRPAVTMAKAGTG